MKRIDFKNGEFAIYDDEFEDLVKFYKWYLRKIVTKTGVETIKIMIHPSKKTTLGTSFLNRTLLNLSDTKKYIIHKNGNYLDCRLENMEVVDIKEGLIKAKPRKNNTVGYKGVRLNSCGNYAAHVKIGKKNIHLGTYKSAWDAAEVYNKNVKELYGNHAYQNIKNESTKKKEKTNI